jgi:hypothetical protein
LYTRACTRASELGFEQRIRVWGIELILASAKVEIMIRPVADVELELHCDVLERQSMESAMDRLAPLFENASGERSALFLVSPNAGSATALRFWADAQTTGVAFANPELFPWCLANAPCAALARRFGIAGPNFTWLGDEEALQAASSAAEYALKQGRIECAFVVSVCFCRRGVPGCLRAWCVRNSPDKF